MLPTAQISIATQQCTLECAHQVRSLQCGSSALAPMPISAQIFVCIVTRSTTAEVQHNDMMMRTNVQNDLRP